MDTFYQVVIYSIYSLLAPIVTAGGGSIVSNALTFTGVSLTVAAGMTSFYFLVNSLIVVPVFWKNIIWSEVRSLVLPAVIGALFGAFFLININETILLGLMFLFSLKFIYEFSQKGVKKDQNKLEVWVVGVTSGFLTGTALPGGGFRNSYLLSRGYNLANVHGTQNLIGVMCWVIKLTVLFNASVLSFVNIEGVFWALPVLFLTNYVLQKKLKELGQSISKKISLIAMIVFSIYALWKITMTFV